MRPRDRSGRIDPELGLREARRGRRPGDRYVRVVQPYADGFKRHAAGHLVASERVLRPSDPLGRAVDLLRRLAIGRRVATEHEIRERVGPIKGLAVFASDNISSSAYATEEIMRVLVLAGLGALALTMPTTIVIVAVMAIVVTSASRRSARTHVAADRSPSPARILGADRASSPPRQCSPTMC